MSAVKVVAALVSLFVAGCSLAKPECVHDWPRELLPGLRVGPVAARIDGRRVVFSMMVEACQRCGETRCYRWAR